MKNVLTFSILLHFWLLIRANGVIEAANIPAGNFLESLIEERSNHNEEMEVLTPCDYPVRSANISASITTEGGSEGDGAAPADMTGVTATQNADADADGGSISSRSLSETHNQMAQDRFNPSAVTLAHLKHHLKDKLKRRPLLGKLIPAVSGGLTDSDPDPDPEAFAPLDPNGFIAADGFQVSDDTVGSETFSIPQLTDDQQQPSFPPLNQNYDDYVPQPSELQPTGDGHIPLPGPNYQPYEEPPPRPGSSYLPPPSSHPQSSFQNEPAYPPYNPPSKEYLPPPPEPPATDPENNSLFSNAYYSYSPPSTTSKPSPQKGGYLYPSPSTQKPLVELAYLPPKMEQGYSYPSPLPQKPPKPSIELAYLPPKVEQGYSYNPPPGPSYAYLPPPPPPLPPPPPPPPPRPPPAVMDDDEEEDEREAQYYYYGIGRHLWYVPLYFSVYFIIYVGYLILKSIARHKVQFPSMLQEAAASGRAEIDEYLLRNLNLVIDNFAFQTNGYHRAL